MLEDLIRDYQHSQNVLESATNLHTKAKANLLEYLTSKREKSVEAAVGGKTYRVAMRKGSERVNIDHDGLLKSLPGSIAVQILDEKVNREKLEKALSSGVLTPDQVQKYLSTTTTAPNVLVSILEEQ